MGGAVGPVALKAFLLYLTAVFVFRLGHRRTLAEMSPFDFVAAVAVGAIVGRVPNAEATTYLQGAVTLVVVLGTHSVLTWLRRFPNVSRLLDYPPRLLVARGKVISAELRRCGLTENDLYGLLRQKGVTDLAQVAFVIFEQSGRVSVVREETPGSSGGGLIHDIVPQATTETADEG